jgi:hypothetical protein
VQRSVSSPSRGADERPQDEQERSPETGLVAFWRSNATALGVAAAALGGVLYVLLTWVASWVYQPAGVKPSDVGLGYVPLLAGTAVTLVAALTVVLAIVAVALGAAWLFRKALGTAWLRKNPRKQAWAVAVAIIALVALAFVPIIFWSISGHVLSGNAVFFFSSLPVAVWIAIISPKEMVKLYRAAVDSNLGAADLVAVLDGLLTQHRQHVYKVITILATIVALVVAVVTVWNGASQARRDIQNATSSVPGVLNNPWEGEIATVQQIGSTTVRCGLYLGESNGTGVLVYNVGTEQVPILRTLRLPLSSVLIHILPDQVLCPGGL